MILISCDHLPLRKKSECLISTYGVRGIWQVIETGQNMVLKNVETSEVGKFKNDNTWKVVSCPVS